MPTIIDSLIVTLGIDVTQFKRGQKQASEDLKRTEEDSNRYAKEIEAAGKNAAQFFSKLRNEALMLFAVFTGANSVKQFIENITNSDAGMARLAKQLNMSTEDLTAWTSAIERTGGSASAAAGTFQHLEDDIQNFRATGQSQLLPYLKSMGIAMLDAHGNARPLQDILLDIAKWTEGRDPAMVSQRLRAMGFDQGTINMLMKGRDAVAGLIQQSKELGVTSDADGQRAQALQERWRALEQAATSLGRTILNDLSPPIINVLGQMVEWAQKNREWIDTKIGEAIQFVIQKATDLYQYLSTVDWSAVWKTLIEWVTQAQIQFGIWFDYLKEHWPEIKQGVLDFAEAVKTISGWIDQAIKATTGWQTALEALMALWVIGKFAPLIGGLSAVLRLLGAVRIASLGAGAGIGGLLGKAGLIAGTGFAVHEGLSAVDPNDKMGTWIDQNVPGAGYLDDLIARYLGIGRTYQQQGEAAAAAGMLAGKNNPADPNQLRDYFLQQGWSANQVAGILANFKAESGFNAGAVGDNGKAAGLGQWRDERRAQFQRMFGHDLTDSTHMEQAQFTQWELTHTEKAAGGALSLTASADAAGQVISRLYERPKDTEGQAKLRGQYAKDLADAAARLSPPQNPVRDINTGAAASPALQNSINNTANNTTNTSTSEINVNGPITVNTQATDAKGVAAGLLGGLKSSLTVQQANGGLN